MQSVQYIHTRASESVLYVLPLSTTIYISFGLFFAYTSYVLLRKHLENQVSESSDLLSDNVDRKQTDGALSIRYGCLPPPQLPNKWPLGIDWIRKLWRSDSEQHLLAFLCSIADGYEPRNNLFQYLLVGPRAFHVLDPKNLEAVLSTNFQGMRLRRGDSSLQPMLTSVSCRLRLR